MPNINFQSMKHIHAPQNKNRNRKKYTVEHISNKKTLTFTYSTGGFPKISFCVALKFSNLRQPLIYPPKLPVLVLSGMVVTQF